MWRGYHPAASHPLECVEIDLTVVVGLGYLAHLGFKCADAGVYATIFKRRALLFESFEVLSVRQRQYVDARTAVGRLIASLRFRLLSTRITFHFPAVCPDNRLSEGVHRHVCESVRAPW